MSEKQLQDLFDFLKKFGLKVEFDANTCIQNGLNKEDILKVLSKNAKLTAKVIEGLKELVENISIPLNFPTKDDVANVAKLTLQNEEKIDALEDQIQTLNEYVRNMNVNVDSNTNQSTTTTNSNHDNQEKKMTKQHRKQLLLQQIISQSPLTANLTTKQKKE
ncbi:hypothetical protein ACFYKX_13575 [Cytobacillus sp. FJAT-54145]|uniref:Uncharacterized protein n=1 Tax=Cytobacillus spartinae TaxID=3299023 RepID=A0ABW6KFG9_9BACI